MAFADHEVTYDNDANASLPGTEQRASSPRPRGVHKDSASAQNNLHTNRDNRMDIQSTDCIHPFSKSPFSHLAAPSDKSCTGSLSLTEENLRALQTELGVRTPLHMPPKKTIPYTDPQYLQALAERGCAFDPRNKSPSNFADIKKQIEAARSDTLTEDAADILWQRLEGANAENIVAAIACSKVIDIVDVRDPESDFWAILGCHYTNVPLSGEFEHSIAAPYPDASIGYNRAKLVGCPRAVKYLGSHCKPVPSDPTLVFPVLTIEAKGLTYELHARHQNMHNAAIMLRNLRKLKQCSGIVEEELRKVFDGVAHVLTISFTINTIQICCCWMETTPAGHTQYFSKPVVTTGSFQGVTAFRQMVDKIRNAVTWATDHNKEGIRNDLKALQRKLEDGATMPSLTSASSMVTTPTTADDEIN